MQLSIKPQIVETMPKFTQVIIASRVFTIFEDIGRTSSYVLTQVTENNCKSIYQNSPTTGIVYGRSAVKVNRNPARIELLPSDE